MSTAEQLEALALAHRSPTVAVQEPVEFLRDIRESDLNLLVEELKFHHWGRLRDQRGLTPIAVLRLGHHQLAQLLAAGVDARECSFITGRAIASIRSLQCDPAFKELLAYYAEMQSVKDYDHRAMLATLGGTALQILRDRLEEAPERFSNNELRQLIESTMDRSAAPTKGGVMPSNGQGVTNLTIKFVAPERRESAIGVTDGDGLKVIEGEKIE
jgi:hypothetical protein